MNAVQNVLRATQNRNKELAQQLELATKKNATEEKELENTVDTLIKGMQELNKELDK